MVTDLSGTRYGGRSIANRQVVKSTLFLSVEEVVREKPDSLKVRR